MNPNIRKFSTSPAPLNASQKPTLTNRPSDHSLPGKTSIVSLASGAEKPTGLRTLSKGGANRRPPDPQQVQRMLRFRACILALDPHAEVSINENPLNVIHSRCKRSLIQKSLTDLSNFREHVSVCQSTRPVTPPPAQIRCPGLNFEELHGNVYNSLSFGERQQVKSALNFASFTWLDPGEKRSIISKACLQESPSQKEPAEPCNKCLEDAKRSNLEELFRSIPKLQSKFVNQFLSIDATRTGAGKDKKASNGGS